MVHIGRFLNVPVWDHLIITKESYYSFLDSGLLEQLENDLTNIPDALTLETLKRETAEMDYVMATTSIAISLYETGMNVEDISKHTRLDIHEVERIIDDFKNGDIEAL